MMNPSSQTTSKRRAALIWVACVIAGCASIASHDVLAERAPQRFAPEEEASIVRLARAARAAGDLPGAVNLYRGVKSPPADSTVPVELGDALDEMGLFDDAIAAYGQVPQNSSARVGALVGLVRVHLRLSQPDRALFYADQAAALAPDDTRVLNSRGVALDTLGQHDKAQQCYRHALEGAHNDVPTRNNLALSLALMSKFDEAIDLMTPLALSSAATPRLRQNLALIYGLKGDRERAREVSRIDLDENATATNLQLFDLAGKR